MANAYLTAGGKLLKTGSGPSLLRIPRNFDQLMRDGHTIGWYAYDTSVGIVGDASVYAWGDKLGGINKLAVTSGALMPSYSSSEGIMFDGINDTLNRSLSSSISQPFMFYIVLKQNSTTNYEHIIAFASSDAIRQFSSNIQLLCGGLTLSATNYLSEWKILRVVANGANSSIQFNSSTATTGSVGTTGIIDSIKIANQLGHINVKELIVRKTADSTYDSSLIYNYLNEKYAVE